MSIALGAFFRILSDAQYAGQVLGLQQAPVVAPSPSPAPVVTKPTPAKPNTDAALQLLALLQRDARLIDFTQEDLSSYSDDDLTALEQLIAKASDASGDQGGTGPARQAGAGLQPRALPPRPERLDRRALTCLRFVELR